MISYTYTILRYVPDPVAGESVNVGLLFYAPEARYVRFLREGRYGHLSKLFSGFQFEEYNKFLSWFASAVERFQASLGQSSAQLFTLEDLPSDAGVFARQLVPDQGLSFQFGTTGSGVTRRVEETAEKLYQRFIASQRPGEPERRRCDDNDVWNIYQGTLSRYSITRALHPHTVHTSSFEIPFDHAFQNEKWHAIKPLSFDYQDTSSIRERAARWMGYGVALQESEEFSKLYLLLGKPSLAAHERDYIRAKDYLRKMPIRPEIVEEDEIEDFARDLAAYMREHGVLSNASSASEETEKETEAAESALKS